MKLNTIKNNKVLYLQRNILLLLTLLLMVITLFLSMALSLKKDKTFLIPMQSNEAWNMEQNKVSDAYISHLSAMYLSLLLDLTPENINNKSQFLLKYVTSNSYHEFLNYYKHEQEKRQKYRLTTSFVMTDIKIEGNKAEVSGILTSKFALDAEKAQAVTFTLTFQDIMGAIYLSSFSKN